MTQRKYAEGTTVSVEKSRNEIESILKRFGADGFMYASQQNFRMVSFTHRGRLIRFTLLIPPLSEFNGRPSSNQYGTKTKEQAAHDAMEAEERRLWRSLANCVKAKLDSVQSGILTFEEEFLAYTVTPQGQTIAELLLPQIDKCLESGQMPALMPGVA